MEKDCHLKKAADKKREKWEDKDKDKNNNANASFAKA